MASGAVSLIKEGAGGDDEPTAPSAFCVEFYDVDWGIEAINRDRPLRRLEHQCMS